VEGPFLGYEVHNTFLDWATATGVLGVMAYVALLAWAVARAWRGGRPELVLMMCALAVFSFFHFVLRHPSFWFPLVITAFAAGRDPWTEHAPSAHPAGSLAGDGRLAAEG
jgi:O-antigen ligase